VGEWLGEERMMEGCGFVGGWARGVSGRGVVRAVRRCEMVVATVEVSNRGRKARMGGGQSGSVGDDGSGGAVKAGVVVLPAPVRARKRKARRGGKRVRRAKAAAAVRVGADGKKGRESGGGVDDEHERYETAREETFAVINAILKQHSDDVRSQRKNNNKAVPPMPPSASARALHESSNEVKAVSMGQRMIDARSLTTRNPDGSQDSSSGGKNSGQLIEVLEFLRGLGLSIEDCGRLVKRRPQLVRLNVPRSAQPYIDFLKTGPLSLNDEQVRRAVRTAPQLFAYKVSMFASRIDFLTSVVGLRPEDLAVAVSKRPHLLWMDLTRAQVVVDWLSAELGLADGELAMIVKVSPMVMLDSQMQLFSTLDWIRNELGLSETEDLHRFIMRFPKVFGFRTETSLQRRVDYFREELQLPQETIARIALECPVALEKSVDSDLKSCVDELLAWQVVSDSKELAQLLHEAPKLFYTRFVNRLRFLNDEVKLDTAQLKAVVSAFPSTLVLSVERTLQPKWQFLTRTYCGTTRDLMKAPHFFSASLERVLLPRFAFMCTKSRRPSLPELVNGTDAEFCEKVARCDLQEYEAFEQNGSWVLVYAPVL